MKRGSKKQAGYDCIRGICPACVRAGRTPNGCHGRHGEEWHYWITADDAETALSLTIYTKIPPDGVWVLPEDKDAPPSAADLSLHVGFPNGDDDKGGECNLFGLTSGRCYDWGSWTTALGATDFWKAHGRPTFEQDEAFWTALEARFVKQDAEARDAHVTLTEKETLRKALEEIASRDCYGYPPRGCKIEMPMRANFQKATDKPCAVCIARQALVDLKERAERA